MCRCFCVSEDERVGGAGPSAGHTVVLSNRTSLFITVVKTKDCYQSYSIKQFYFSEIRASWSQHYYYFKSGLRDGSWHNHEDLSLDP